MTQRSFDDREAVREQVPLLVGLVGPSSSGKTMSALRLATGMQSVVGGEIFCIDTESRRALHYSDSFKFRHVEFKAPFSPLDYMAAIEHCAKKNASVVIVDSASHEHEGPGGVLEWHEEELDRLAGDDFGKRNRMTFSAWAKPKAARRRLINTILQLGVNAIFCFRAKPKLKIRRGQNPVELGWMPISGDDWPYEMTVTCLLYPGSGGVPTWETDYVGERSMMKLPVQFEGLFSQPKPLDESIGRALAEWARGGEQATAEKTAASSTDACLDEIRKAFVDGGLGGSDPKVRKQKVAVLKECFHTASWTEVSQMQLEDLEIGLQRLREHFANAPEIDPDTGEEIPADLSQPSLGDA